MSLVNWWTLNGTLEDYIGNNNLIAYNSFNLDNNGKIGKCYSATTTSSYAETNTVIYSEGNISMCCWFKLKAYSTNPTAIMTLHEHNSTSNLGINLSNNKLAVSIGYVDNTREWSGRNSSTIIELDKWYHVVLTFNRNLNKLSLYVNGNREYSAILSKEVKFTPRKLQINRWSVGYTGYTATGSYNDIRIYDHELSSKEVRELSKANILHYKFNDNMEEPTTNLKNSVNLTTAEKGEDYFVKKESDTWTQGASLPSTNVTAGKTYTWSMDIRCDREFPIKFDPNCTADNYTGNDQAMETSKLSTSKYDTPSKWKRIYLTVTVKSDATNPRLHHAFCPAAITGVNLKVYVRRPLLEEKDHNTPYTKISRNIGISDSSGFRNHANINPSTSPKWNNDSIMGDYCISGINGSNRFITVQGNCKPTDEATISFWLKINNNTGGSWTSLFGGPRDGGSTHKGGISIHINTENKIFTKFYGTSSKVDMTSSTLNITGWNHIVITHKNNSHNIYINGIKSSNSTDIGPLDWTNTNTLYIGRAMDNFTSRDLSIDDFRIYATQLSDSDISELYQVKGSVSKNGRLFVNEINERVNLFNPDTILDRQTILGVNTNSKLIEKDNRRCIAMSASSYYSNSTAHSIFYDNYFKQNTSYIFELTINGNLIHQEKEVPCGFRILFSDGTYNDTFVVKTSGNWNRFRYTSPSNKTIVKVEVYYYIGNLFYVDLEKSSIYENINPNLNKRGILEGNEILELDCSSMKVKNYLDTTWVRLFYHNNKSGTVLFSADKSEFLKCKTEDKISDLWALEMFRNIKDGKFELLLQYQSGGSSYNRWKQSSNFTRDPIQGYEAVQVSWNGSYWGGLEYNGGTSTWVDGSVNHTNWYYAIGAKAVYSGGIPAWSSAETGWVELWVRCEDPEVMKMLKNGNCRATEFIEI